VWNEYERRIEMHLVSRRAQTVEVPGAGIEVRFAPGESIRTESSYKYIEEQIQEMGAIAGFTTVEQWIEREARFALTIFEAA
jgi:uncharacterized SAM-dependent methyltransferase